MGYRSDVGLALTTELRAKCPEELWTKMVERADTVLEAEEGVMLKFGAIKWYDDGPGWLAYDVKQWLRSQEYDFDEYDFKLLVLHYDAPDDDSDDWGAWDDNPWEMRRNWVVSLDFENYGKALV